jgi:asparagine synthase (glutamine-hydrolysing)
MCGIAGVLELERAEADAPLLERMTDLLEHRGPDDEGFFVDGPIALGHRRLSIIDLSPGGHQPMSSADGRFWLTYNGEIYNYVELRRDLEARGRRLRSASDTEVLVEGFAAWGHSLLDRLNGMFAFAVWDRRARTLTCVRDRFGVKPLYYAHSHGRFRFASEIKALFADPSVARAPNEPRLLEFLGHGLADHTGETFYRGIHQVEPGTFLEVDARTGRPRTRRWYTLRATEPPADDAAAVQAVLEDAVRLRLRSDVPVGTCLSGGVDSSSVVALAARARKAAGAGPPDAFSARSADARVDEGRWIDEVARATGTSTHAVYPSDRDAAEVLDRVLWHMDEPFHAASVIGQWKVMELARECGVKVLLDGQGGDEVYAGYHYMYPSFLVSLLAEGRLALVRDELRTRARVHGVAVGTTLTDVAKLLAPRTVRGRSLPDWLADGGRSGVAGRLLRDQQRFALTVSPLPAYLHHEDRNSMAFSLEARVPFLDYRNVELGISLRASQLLRGGYTKHVLRRAMAGIVPDGVLWRPDKQGFTVAQTAWLRGALAPLLAETIADAERRPWYDRDALRRTLRDGREDALWRPFMAERWLQLLVESPRPAPARASRREAGTPPTRPAAAEAY